MFTEELTEQERAQEDAHWRFEKMRNDYGEYIARLAELDAEEREEDDCDEIPTLA
jgi:hypothetical protein